MRDRSRIPWTYSTKTRYLILNLLCALILLFDKYHWRHTSFVSVRMLFPLSQLVITTVGYLHIKRARVSVFVDTAPNKLILIMTVTRVSSHASALNWMGLVEMHHYFLVVNHYWLRTPRIFLKHNFWLGNSRLDLVWKFGATFFIRSSQWRPWILLSRFLLFKKFVLVWYVSNGLLILQHDIIPWRS